MGDSLHHHTRENILGHSGGLFLPLYPKENSHGIDKLEANDHFIENYTCLKEYHEISIKVNVVIKKDIYTLGNNDENIVAINEW